MRHIFTRSGGLALLLAMLVISLCMSQRMGLKLACALEPAPAHQTQLTNTIPNGADLAQKERNSAPDQHSCSLSEQLLSKVFQHLDPLFIAILLLFALWLAPIKVGSYGCQQQAPLLFSGRRRHLVLCVFRE